MRRRDVLALASLAALWPSAALALGDSSTFDVVEIQLPGTLSRPGAWQRMLHDLARVTSVEVADPPRVVQLPPDDLALFDHPFAVLCGDQGFAPVDEAVVEQLKRYITYGGFLFIDDATGADDSDFDRSVRRLLRRMFPTREVQRLEAGHSVYRSFFLLDAPVGRIADRPWLEGIKLGSIFPLLYGRNDLSGALERSPTGRGLRPVVPGGERQRREAEKLAINLAMYALTSNYKRDQAHVKELIEQGRL